MRCPFAPPRWILAGLLGVVLMTLPAVGQFMLSPTSVVGTDLGTFDPIASVENMINQSGIDIPFVSGTTDFTTYFDKPRGAFGQNGGSNNWQSNFTFELPLTGFVDFDLGASYRIDKIAIWNVSVKEVTLKVYQELSGPEQVAGTFTLTNHLNFPFTYSADVLSLGSSFEGRYLRLAISSAYLFAPSDTFAYAIIGEVVVSARTPSSPNPTAIALDPNGDVRVTFSGTLESSTVLNGAFDDVPGSPAGTYVIPKGELVSEQYFRVKGEFTGETP